MKSLNLLQVSTEAIRYQGRSVLFHDLVSAYDNLRSLPPRIDPHSRMPQPYSLAELNAVGFSAIIDKHTKMKVTVLATSGDGSFYADPPLIDAKNPYVKMLTQLTSDRTVQSSLERHQRVLRLAETSVGMIDKSKGTVGGVFSSMFSSVFVPTEVLSDARYTTEELAAMTIHELGHIYGYFELVAETTAGNLVINSALTAVADNESPERQYSIIADSFSALGLPAPDKSVMENPDPKVLAPVLTKAVFDARTKARSTTGSAEYDTRSLEFLADQFAVRHGASLYLASALNKMGVDQIPDYGRSNLSFILVQALRYGLLVSLAAWSLPVGLAITALGAFLATGAAIEDDSIADPSERMARIKADLVQLLKDRKLSSEQRKQVLNDVEAVDALRAQIKEHPGLIRMLYRNLTPNGRKQASIREFQKGLEELVQNDLFVASARFSI